MAPNLDMNSPQKIPCIGGVKPKRPPSHSLNPRLRDLYADSDNQAINQVLSTRMHVLNFFSISPCSAEDLYFSSSMAKWQHMNTWRLLKVRPVPVSAEERCLLIDFLHLMTKPSEVRNIGHFASFVLVSFRFSPFSQDQLGKKESWFVAFFVGCQIHIYPNNVGAGGAPDGHSLGWRIRRFSLLSSAAVSTILPVSNFLSRPR
jgi:hypothetical protein